MKRVVRLCRRMSWDVPLCLGIPGTSHQSQVWNMLSPSCPSRPIVPWYLGIPWNVPPVPALAPALILAQTKDWWDVWDPKVPWNYGTGWTKKPSMYPRPVTGGMSHGIPRHYGTMGHPEVPVDILRHSWTTMSMNHFTGKICNLFTVSLGNTSMRLLHLNFLPSQPPPWSSQRAFSWKEHRWDYPARWLRSAPAPCRLCPDHCSDS